MRTRTFFPALLALAVPLGALGAQSPPVRDSVISRGLAKVRASNDSVSTTVFPGLSKYCRRPSDDIKDACLSYARLVRLSMTGVDSARAGLAMPNVAKTDTVRVPSKVDTLRITRTVRDTVREIDTLVVRPKPDTVRITRTVRDTVKVVRSDTVRRFDTLVVHDPGRVDTVTKTITQTVHDTVFVTPPRDSVVIVRPPPPPPPPPPPGVFAAATFDDGTTGGFYNNFASTLSVEGAGDVDIIPDPTGANRGKIARVHFVGANQDKNRYFSRGGTRIGLGQTVYFKGDFYLAGTETSPFFQRKLIYYQSLSYVAGQQYWSIPTLMGTELKWTNGVIGKERMSGVLAKLQLNRWYTLETEITLNSCFSCNDGVGRLWLDGVLLDEFTGFSWSNPAWQGVQDPSKQYWDIFLIGDQVSYEQGAFNEYRYWDNVTMATGKRPSAAARSAPPAPSARSSRVIPIKKP